jgi:hypothetical protein
LGRTEDENPIARQHLDLANSNFAEVGRRAHNLIPASRSTSLENRIQEVNQSSISESRLSGRLQLIDLVGIPRVGILAVHVPCEEKRRLLDLYTSAMARYSATVNDMTVTHGKTSQPKYNRLFSLSEKAWTATEASRLDLERHTKKHGC